MSDVVNLEAATRAVLRVGDGRGFVVQGQRSKRYVITVVHCLPHVPPAGPFSCTEVTYRNLLGPLGEVLSVWAECLFVDPVSDLAVLREPDGQMHAEEWEAYDKLVEAAEALPIGKLAEGEPIWILGLDGRWMRLETEPSTYCILTKGDTAPGTSGSPIVTATGVAVGTVSTGNPNGLAAPHPGLFSHLPAWMWRETSKRWLRARKR
jgi:Trypsin-like peptidase domain